MTSVDSSDLDLKEGLGNGEDASSPAASTPDVTPSRRSSRKKQSTFRGDFEYYTRAVRKKGVKEEETKVELAENLSTKLTAQELNQQQAQNDDDDDEKLNESKEKEVERKPMKRKIAVKKRGKNAMKDNEIQEMEEDAEEVQPFLGKGKSKAPVRRKAVRGGVASKKIVQKKRAEKKIEQKEDVIEEESPAKRQKRKKQGAVSKVRGKKVKTENTKEKNSDEEQQIQQDKPDKKKPEEVDVAPAAEKLTKKQADVRPGRPPGSGQKRKLTVSKRDDKEWVPIKTLKSNQAEKVAPALTKQLPPSDFGLIKRSPSEIAARSGIIQKNNNTNTAGETVENTIDTKASVKDSDKMKLELHIKTSKPSQCNEAELVKADSEKSVEERATAKSEKAKISGNVIKSELMIKEPERETKRRQILQNPGAAVVRRRLLSKPGDRQTNIKVSEVRGEDKFVSGIEKQKTSSDQKSKFPPGDVPSKKLFEKSAGDYKPMKEAKIGSSEAKNQLGMKRLSSNDIKKGNVQRQTVDDLLRRGIFHKRKSHQPFGNRNVLKHPKPEIVKDASASQEQVKKKAGTQMAEVKKPKDSGRRKSSDSSKLVSEKAKFQNSGKGERRKSEESIKKADKPSSTDGEGKHEPCDEPPALIPVTSLSKVRHKHHKSEHDIPVDMTMMDLFKPDGLVIHDQQKKDVISQHGKSLEPGVKKSQCAAETCDSTLFIKADHVQHVLLEHQYSKPSSPCTPNQEGETGVDYGGGIRQDDDVESVSYKQPVIIMDMNLPEQILEESEEPVPDGNLKASPESMGENLLLNKEVEDRQMILESQYAELNDSGTEFRIVGQVEVDRVTVAPTEGNFLHKQKTEVTDPEEVLIKNEAMKDEEFGMPHSETRKQSTDERKDSTFKKEGKDRKSGSQDIVKGRKAVKLDSTADKDTHEKNWSKESGFEDDHGDLDWEPSDSGMLYCLCRMPHSNRFMICCDKCEEWFHGTCVGISRAQGKEMEEKQQEYICPFCSKGEDSTGSEKPTLQNKTAEQDTAKSKLMHRCVGRKCSKAPRPGSVYCSNECIMSHAQESLRAPREEQMQKKIKEEHMLHEDSKSSSSASSSAKTKASSMTAVDTVELVERETGKVPKGSSALTEKGLHHWLEQHATSEAVDPYRHRHRSLSFRDERQREKDTKSGSPRRHCSDKESHGSHSSDKESHGSHSSDKESHRRNSSDKESHRRHSSDKESHRRHSSDKESHKSHSSDKGSHRRHSSDKESYRRHSSEKERGKSSEQDKKSDWKDKPCSDNRSRHDSTSSKDSGKRSDSGGRHSTSSQKSDSAVSSKVDEMKDDGPNQIRINVRTALRDGLAARAQEAEDIMLSSNEIKCLAVTIEEELFAFFNDTGHKYRTKYRSLIFNIKDQKNKGLFRKILTGKITPNKLIQMSTEELASRELAKWREQASKHELEMIEKTEQEAVKESESIKHVRKKTHKGEVEVEDEDLSILEARLEEKKELDLESHDNQTQVHIVDTTDQHRAHLFDLHCKVCTGKIVPALEEQAAMAAAEKSSLTAAPLFEHYEEHVDEVSHVEDEEDFEMAEAVVKEALQTVQKMEQTISNMPKIVSSSPKSEEILPPLSPKLRSSRCESSSSASSASSLSTKNKVIVRLADSALQSGLEAKPKFTPTGPVLWKGFLSMQDVAKFFTSAYRISGPADNVVIPDTVHILGRISPDHMWDYLSKLRQAGSKDVTVVRFIPGSDDEKVAYVHLYSYLNSRGRCGVAGNPNKQIRDLYVVPLASHSKIPQMLLPFHGPGLEENRPHMLIGILVHQRAKRGGETSEASSSTTTSTSSTISTSSIAGGGKLVSRSTAAGGMGTKSGTSTVNRDPRLAKLAAKEGNPKESPTESASSTSSTGEMWPKNISECQPEYIPLHVKPKNTSKPEAEHMPTPAAEKKNDRTETLSVMKCGKTPSSHDSCARESRDEQEIHHHRHRHHHHQHHHHHHHHHEKIEELEDYLEPYSPGKEAEPYSPGKGSEPYSPGKEAEPYSPGKEAEPYSPGKEAEPYSPGKEAEPYSPGKEAEPYSPGKEAEADEPYDPADENLMDESGVPIDSSSSIASSSTLLTEEAASLPAAMPEGVSSASSVDQDSKDLSIPVIQRDCESSSLVEQMAQSNDSQEISALMLAALSAVTCGREQQKLLVELTKKVEQRKLQLAEAARLAGRRCNQSRNVESAASGRLDVLAVSGRVPAVSCASAAGQSVQEQVTSAPSSSFDVGSVAERVSSSPFFFELAVSGGHSSETVPGLGPHSVTSSAADIPPPAASSSSPPSSSSSSSTSSNSRFESTLLASNDSAGVRFKDSGAIKFCFTKSRSKTCQILSTATAQVFSVESAESKLKLPRFSAAAKLPHHSVVSGSSHAPDRRKSQEGTDSQVLAGGSVDIPDALKALMNDVMGNAQFSSLEKRRKISLQKDVEEKRFEETDLVNDKAEAEKLMREKTAVDILRRSAFPGSSDVDGWAMSSGGSKLDAGEVSQKMPTIPPSIDELLDRLKKGGFKFHETDNVSSPTALVTTATTAADSLVSTRGRILRRSAEPAFPAISSTSQESSLPSFSAVDLCRTTLTSAYIDLPQKNDLSSSQTALHPSSASASGVAAGSSVSSVRGHGYGDFNDQVPSPSP